jgi:hypothetical protein
MKFVSGHPCPSFFARTARTLSLSLAIVAVAAASQSWAQTSTSASNAPAADDNFHYDNLWEISGGLSYAAMPSGPNIQHRAQLAGLDVAATQWIFPRLGATADVRTHIGLADTNVNPYTVNSPLFVETFGSVGPEYRLVRTPAFGVTLHALAGGGYGIFDLHVPGGVTAKQLGNYPNGATFDLIGGANFDFNTPSGFGVRVSPNVLTTDFDSNLRNSFSLTVGLLWRYGKF